MKLPEPLLSAVQRYFDSHHPHWHLARMRKTEMETEEEKVAWDAARKMFPDLKFRDEPGAGAEFLTFHREMMREYKWLLNKYPTKVAYDPWSTIPHDVRDFLETNYNLPVEEGLNTISDLTLSGLLSDIGGFIEPSPAGNYSGGGGLHDLSHGAVSQLEKKKKLPKKFSMGSPSTAHRNIVFYQLHGWIDECYAAWQRAHGETPDLSPKEPSEMHGVHGMHGMVELSNVDTLNDVISAVDRLLKFDRHFLKKTGSH
jgi:hypothetical protein